MATIKAPYNFVPLEDTVFFPEWQNRISQDIPFSDGVSGRIDIKIEAKTPIFVRNGQAQLTEQEKKEGKKGDDSFSHTDDGRYFIPGTSIKGELRNVLEILSFGKMTQVQDARFGIRDLKDKNYRELINNVHCGWLERRESYFVIEDCGEPLRISPKDIDKHYNSSLMNFDTKLKGNATDEEKSAFKKYKLLGALCNKENDVDFSKLEQRFSFFKDDKSRKIYKIDEKGNKSGTIVCTGQPGMRNEERGTGKYYEFVFFKENGSAKEMVIADEVISDFKTVHKNNSDFKKLWHKIIETGCGKIPVFFTIAQKSSLKYVNAIGLSYMFRFPATSSIHTAIPKELLNNEYKDLAECIFGTATQNHELKGRVFISPAFSIGQVQKCKEVKTTLSSPKPSFASLYVEQGSWMNTNARIKGRKRYPVRNSTWGNETGNGNTETKFIPLASGTTFSGHIYFHNLKKVELGALISALTFNGHSECFHSIGEAKPLGFGKVKISIERIEDTELKNEQSIESIGTYLKAFQDKISNSVLKGKTLEDYTSVKEFIAMAAGIPDGQNNSFEYLSMSTNGKDNEFLSAKEYSLPRFTDIILGKLPSKAEVTIPYGQTKYVSSVIENAIQKSNEIKAEEENKFQKKLSEDIANAEELESQSKFDEAIEQYKRILHYFNQPNIKIKVQECEQRKAQDEYRHRLSSADKLFDNKAYKEALDMYQEIALSQNTPEVQNMIAKCKREIEKGGRIIKGISSYLPQSLSSISAYTGRIDKWIKECGVEIISDADKDKIIENINSLLGSLSNKDRKEWGKKAPGKLKQYLGDDIAKLSL